MIVFDNERLIEARECQPYHVYQRVTLANPENHFIFQLPYGFWYVLRKIHAQYAETDGVNWFPEITFYVYLMGVNKWPQNVPAPFRLITTPNCTGVTMLVAGMQAGEIVTAKMLNTIHPVRDTLNVTIVRPGVAPFVPFVDMDCIGYLIPYRDNEMWEEGKNA